MGISDWNLAELGHVNWNTFTKSDDHIVPHRGDEFIDEYSLCHNLKKPRYEVYENVGMNGTDKYSATKPVVHGNYGTSNSPPTQHTNSSTIFVPSLCDLKKSVKRKVMDTVSNTDIKSMILESTQKSNVQFDWPDLGNYQDIEKMFGNWDPTYDQQQTASINELPWFSSFSNTNYGSEITFEEGYQSSASNFVASHNKYESSDLNSDMHGIVASISDYDKSMPSNHAPWSGTDGLSKDKSNYKEKVESQQSSKDNGTESADQIPYNSVSASKIYFSKVISQQKQFTGSSNYIPISEPICGIPVYQIPCTMTLEHKAGFNSASDCKISNDAENHLYVPQSIGSDEITDKQSQKHPFQFHASVKRSPIEAVDNAEMEDADHREKVNSFLQLNYAIHQMDVVSKACIRDSLYRLARSASHRRGFTMQNDNESSMDKNGGQTFGKSNRSSEFINTEANTNPIDRSIAHLLFHRPIETPMQSAVCTTQANSYIV